MAGCTAGPGPRCSARALMRPGAGGEAAEEEALHPSVCLTLHCFARAHHVPLTPVSA